jgi:hypothetical protein
MNKTDLLQLPDTQEVICTAKDLKDLVREVEEELKNEIKKTFIPGMRDLLPIETVIGKWRELHESLGGEIIWQDMGDDRHRPIKAIYHTPLWAFQEILKIGSEIEKRENCRHEWRMRKPKISFEMKEFDPQDNPEKECIKCGEIN